MNDEELRLAEREVTTNPTPENQEKLFIARQRMGFETTSYYRLYNTKTKKYFVSHYFNSYTRHLEEIAGDSPYPSHHTGYFDSKDMLYGAIKKLINAKHNAKNPVDIANYQIVEFQKMTISTPKEKIEDIKDQVEMELLLAKKEAQLKKLRKMEEEEQEILRKRAEAEEKKLKNKRKLQEDKLKKLTIEEEKLLKKEKK